MRERYLKPGQVLFMWGDSVKKIEEHFEPFPILETKRTYLRPISLSDLNDIAGYCKVPEVSRYTVWDVHKSIEDTKAFIDFVLGRYETQRIGPWGIEFKETGRIIGSCSFVSWDNRNRRAELGYPESVIID